MRLFSRLYLIMLHWASHRHAPRYLAVVSFAESSFFPIPPDVMLIPMSLARPHMALRYAALTTAFSVLGGIFGYLLGVFAIHWLMPMIESSNYYAYYSQALEWFAAWGVWVIIIAGFSPIPYKIFTITAGILSMPFLPFVLASAIGRGARFFILAIVLYYQGARIERWIRKFIEWIGWILVLILVLLYYAQSRAFGF